MEKLFAGYARVCINPDAPVPLDGYGNNHIRTTDHILDDLYATCIAFRWGDETILWYTQDLLNTKFIMLPEARKRITERTGVPSEKIFLCSTHTHSGPWVYGETPAVQSFLEIYWNGVAEAAEKAIADLAPATLQSASTILNGMNFVRHYIMNDGTYAGSNFGSIKSGVKSHADINDPQMQVVQVCREDKQDLLIMNWQAHPCMTGGSTKKDISADYIAAVRSKVERDTGMLFAFFQGPAGNQGTGTWIPEEDHKLDHIQYGEKLAQTAIDLLPSMKELDSGGLQTLRVYLEADVNHDDEELLPYAKEVAKLWKETEDRDAGNKLARQHGLTSVYHAHTVIARSERPKRNKMELNAVRIGDLAFVTTPFEMFAANGITVKTTSPFETTLICTCCNGDFVYVPTAKAYDYGCYERSVSYFAKGTGELVTEEFKKMLNALK